jgi:hypothetical protein
MIETVDTRKRAAWLRAREGAITSTEVAALYGVHPRLSELGLFHSKHPLGGSAGVEEVKQNERMLAGKKLEPAIARWAMEQFGWKARKDYDFRLDPDVRAGASYDYAIEEGKLDGVVVDGWGLEIKQVDYLIFRDQWRMEGTTEPPPHIELQTHLQRALDDRPGTVILACVGGNKLETVLQPSKRLMQEVILEDIQAFWALKEEPKPDFRRDAELVARLYASSGDAVLDAREGPEHRRLRELGELLASFGAAKSEAEKYLKAIKAEILTLADQHSKVLVPNGSISCGTVKGKPPEIITEDMVGQEIGGRKSYRACRFFPLKFKKGNSK